MAEKRPTLAAVAAKAGVSVSTASLAFSGSGPVAAATRQKVLEAAADLGYAGPDPRARSLRSGRSGILAAVLADTIRYAFSDPVAVMFLDGIAAEIAEAGMSLLVVPQVGTGPATLETAAMDVAVLVGCNARAGEAVAAARSRALPVVCLGPAPAEIEDLPMVTIDDRGASRALAEHLAGLGHRRVAVVSLSIDADRGRGPLGTLPAAAGTVAVTQERLAGVRDIFGDVPVQVTAGSLVEEGWAAGRALLAGPAASTPRDGAIDLFSAHDPLRALPASRRPTAIVAQSDLLAAGVIRAAEELGLRVPDDLSVVGFDGVRIDTTVPHDLTTMVQPAKEQGRAAAALALALLDDQPAEDVLLRCEFHPGATTGPPAS